MQRDLVTGGGPGTTLDQGRAAARAWTNIQSHRVISETADDIYLSPNFNRLLFHYARISMAFYRPADADQAANIELARSQQDAIIDAIENRGAACVGTLAEDHWQLSRHQIEQFATPQPLDALLGTAV